MPADGTANLIPFSQRTQEEARELGRAGGQASGKARRLKRTQADILRQILALEETDEKRRELLKALGLEGNFADSINYTASIKARDGDVEAMRYVRDTIGEKPREGLELGNLDDRPLATIDLSKMSDEQLQAMAAARNSQAKDE